MSLGLERWFGAPHNDAEEHVPSRAIRPREETPGGDGTSVLAALSPDDATVIAQLQSGDESVAAHALEHLHQLWAAPLARYVERVIHAPDVADDIVQDVFFTVWMRRASLLSSGSLRAYLYGAVHRRALQVLRNARVAERWSERVATEMVASGVAEHADVATSVSELADVIRTAIDGLAPRQREAILLYRERELSLAEVAQVMGISVNTVKVQIQRAGAALRAAVEAYLSQA